MEELHKKLHREKLLDDAPFQLIEAMESKKLISVYYELRLVLYLGILLFTGGVGYIVYQNMSSIGHIAVMVLLLAIIGFGSYYLFKNTVPYSSGEVKAAHMYFDYVVVLVALLVIALFTYVQVYFDLEALLFSWTSFISGVLFLYMAYRFDNKMVLSLGITAWAAVLGLSISPVNWVSGEWLEPNDIYILAFSYGSFLLVLGQVLEIKDIKKHFVFTYHNFALILLFVGFITLLFDADNGLLVAFLLLAFSVFIAWYTWKRRQFLFFLYGCFSGYIAFTYMVFSIDNIWELAFFYFPITCITGVILLVKNRNHFSDEHE